MRILCASQQSPEWRNLRSGKITASRVGNAMARLSKASKNGVKGDWAAAHVNYVSELAWELITGVPADHYVSKPMEIGTQFEGEARIEYWMRYGTEVEQTGFVLHPTLDWLGASPDGLVGTDGGLEIKVPQFGTHCSYLESGEIPEAYKLQMYTNMLCCERQWWDFASYCPPEVSPEMPEEFRMFRKRLFADAEIFQQIEECATQTIEEAVALVAKLRALYPKGDMPRSRAEHKTRQEDSAYDPSKPFHEQDLSFLDRGGAVFLDTP